MTPHAYPTTPAYASQADCEPALLLNLGNTAMTGLLLALIMVFIISQPPRSGVITFDMPNCGLRLGQAQATQADRITLDFDGQLEWNGQVITGQQLDSYLKDVARQEPGQRELHLRISPFASYQQASDVLARIKHDGVSVVDMSNVDLMLFGDRRASSGNG